MFFTKSYFASRYFVLLTGPRPVATPATLPSDGFEEIVAALRSSGEFAEVALGDPAEVALADDGRPVVILVPEGWSETDDALSGFRLRRVEYRLILRVWDDDPRRRLRRLDQLADGARDILESSTLRGACLPGQSRLGPTRYAPRSTDGELEATVSGEFVYRRAAVSPRP